MQLYGFRPNPSKSNDFFKNRERFSETQIKVNQANLPQLETDRMPNAFPDRVILARGPGLLELERPRRQVYKGRPFATFFPSRRFHD